MPTVRAASDPVPWSLAWARAASSFYAGGAGRAGAEPRAHFRTASHAGAVLGRAIARVVGEVDAALGSPQQIDVVDVGAGAGELLVAVLAALPGDVAARVSPVAVDVRPRPDGLDTRVRWVQGWAPESVPAGLRGLVLAHELLDDVPCDVVEVDAAGAARLVLVDAHGVETLGPSLTDDAGWEALGRDASPARAWLSAWWPLRSVGDRAEVGWPRDRVWSELVARLDAGSAIAVDYGHLREGRPARGSLGGYRDGGRVAPVPDGASNVTAHVAVDAVAFAAGAGLVRQRDALQALGVRGALPGHALSATSPAAYLEALAAATDEAELLDPSGLGSFWWIRTDV